VIFIVFGIPLLFWSEETPTNIVLDSMTLLFLFKLDDLSDVLCSYVGMTQSDFQRTVACMLAFLAQCPVDLEKVINADAKSRKDLWCIRVDEHGKVLGSDGLPCATRLQYVQEEDPVIRQGAGRRVRIHRRFTHYGSSDSLLSATKFKLTCHRSRSHCVTLPSNLTKNLARVWDFLYCIVWTGNIVIPIIWYLINKRCYPAAHGHRTPLISNSTMPS